MIYNGIDIYIGTVIYSDFYCDIYSNIYIDNYSDIYCDIPSPTLLFIGFLVNPFFFALKIMDFVFEICRGFIFICLNNQFGGKLVPDSDLGHFFK